MPSHFCLGYYFQMFSFISFSLDSGIVGCPGKGFSQMYYICDIREFLLSEYFMLIIRDLFHPL